MRFCKYLNISLFSLFFLFYLSGCYTSGKLPINQNVSYIYNPGAFILHPQTRIFHNSDTTSLLFFSISKSEIKLLTSNDKNIYKGKLKFHYELYNNFDNNVIVDSSSVIFNIETTDLSNHFSSEIMVKTRKNQKYSLYLIINDLQTQSWFQTFLFIDKSSPFSSQNYLTTKKGDDNTMFNNCITSNDTLQIINNRIKLSKIFVRYFKNKFPMPPTPYSINNIKPLLYKADSTWVINITDSTCLVFNRMGIYHLQSDSVNSEGMTLFNFDDNFPIVNTPENLLKPLQYLTTTKEYYQYIIYASKKEAVDDFWLRVSGNTDRAKELIRVYYNRVMYANKYFSSYVEGWKTDRGMIYIIFGLPTTIYKSDDRERWIYGKIENMGEMVFDFTKTENPLTDNDYELLRSDKYKNIWYLAIETWRDGRMFSVAN